MIPKKIHYCWFGQGEKPKLAQKCIASWKKYCPDYEIIEWNEDNFDVNLNEYTQYCYENKKWAYLSDYVRLYVVEKNGGLYFDTDVELIRNTDELLKLEAFYGFETDKFVASGLGFGAVEHHETIKAMLEEYSFFGADIDGNLIGCPILNTQALKKMGLELNGKYQTVAKAVIFPVEYFNPYDDATGKLNKTKETFSIHWYAKSALGKKARIRSIITRPFHRIFGVDCFRILKKRIKC